MGIAPIGDISQHKNSFNPMNFIKIQLKFDAVVAHLQHTFIIDLAVSQRLYLDNHLWFNKMAITLAILKIISEFKTLTCIP